MVLNNMIESSFKKNMLREDVQREIELVTNDSKKREPFIV